MTKILNNSFHTLILITITKNQPEKNTTHYLRKQFIFLPSNANHIIILLKAIHRLMGPVGIAIGYGLDGPGIESRWGARFSAPVQTGPGAHPASCTMGTGSFPGVKSGQGVTLTPHPLLVPLVMKE